MLAAALLALLGVVHIAPALHFAAVRHQLCAEHGQLHHGDGSDVRAEAVRDSSGDPAASQSAPWVEHEHEHCSALAAGCPRALAPASSSSEWAWARRTLSGALAADTSAKPSVELLCYAPKLAPPV